MDGAWPVEQIRAAEQRVMSSVPDGSLMIRAAHAIAVQACRMVGFSYGARVVLLVGAGDNGGDSLYAGAELCRRGVAVRALLAVPERAHAGGLAAFRRAGGQIVAQDPAKRDSVGDVDLIVDGLVGIGAKGPLRPALLPLVEFADASFAPVLAVDIPSGVDPDTGAIEGPAISAAVTVCMGALKPGLLVGPGRLRSGTVHVVDIGIGPELPEPEVRRLAADDVADIIGQKMQPGPEDDKYTRGVVGVAAGSQRYPGAARLAVGSARLGGIGAVRYAGECADAVAADWPDVLVSRTVTEAGRVQSWVVGPGLGDGDHAIRELDRVLAADVPVLVDADGLNLLAGDVSRVAIRSAATVLTPHDREFARLFGEVGPDRIAAARRAAKASDACVLLKGYATVIADPSGRCFVNPTGVSALATAGSGDVLSGLIGSLMATGLDPLEAAAVGAYLHGAAGSLAAEGGPVTASDLVSVLRGVVARAS